jgi:hypothetical protein
LLSEGFYFKGNNFEFKTLATSSKNLQPADPNIECKKSMPELTSNPAQTKEARTLNDLLKMKMS